MRLSSSSHVGIVGLGLMGGSLARALKGLPSPPQIRALSSDPADLEGGLKAGVVDQAMDRPKDFLEGLEFLVYCTPLNATLQLLEAHRGLLDPKTVVTDVASLKGPIMDKVSALDLHSVFVGSHPMAGGEGRGYLSSMAGLYQDAKVWIVTHGAPEDVVIRVEGFWSAIGARGERIDAGVHDDLMVWISHLPQLTANALALALSDRGIKRVELGPGGRGMTRLAASAPDMWMDLLENAPGGLPEALEVLESFLAELRQTIQRGDWEAASDLFRRCRSWHRGDGWS